MTWLAIRYTPRMPEANAAARRTRRIVQTIVVLVLWGLITHGTYAGSGDEPHYLAIAHSIAFDADLDLADNYGANEPLIAGGSLLPEAHVRAGTNGVTRPVHDVGLAILFAPVVRIAVPLTNLLTRIVPEPMMRRARLNPAVLYRHLLSLAMIAIAAVLAGLMFDTFAALGGPPRRAAAAVLLVALSPPLLIMSVLFFTELVSAVLCLFVFRRIAIEKTDGVLWWCVVGVGTGFLWLVHARNIGLVIPLAVLALTSMRGRSTTREAAAFALGLAGMLALRTAINLHFWGTFVTSPHARLGTDAIDVVATVQVIATRFAGLLLDQEFGLVIYAPLYLLAFAGWIALMRERPTVARQMLFVASVYVGFILLPFTNVHGWSGGWSPVARFLTPVVPLLGIAVMVSLRTVRREAIACVLAAQIALDAYAWQHPKLMWNDGDGRAAFCGGWLEPMCRVLPSLADNPATSLSVGPRPPGTLVRVTASSERH
jgi:hypothetical protein